MKYAWIDRNRAHLPLSILCEQPDVSASGFHQHVLRHAANDGGKPGSNRISEDALLAHIKAIHVQVKGEYGWPRIWKKLLARGDRVGKEPVRTLLKRLGIKARTKRKFNATTNSAHVITVVPNMIQRDFAPVAANTVWTTDIPYLATDEGWLYLTVMQGLLSRQVVGWSIGSRMIKNW